MKIKQNLTPAVRNSRAFTLIEMIGVLAVIAILAALLIPKVFNAINNARINNTVASIETIKTAVADHYGKYGSFALYGTNGITTPVANYDTSVLLAEGMIDKPFAVKVGTNAVIQLVAGNLGAGGTTTGYSFDGSTTNISGNQSYTIEAKISGVAAQDALDMSALLDGPALGATNATAADTAGRVEYAAIASGAVGTVYVYITGR